AMRSFPTTTPVSITEWTRACLFSPRRCPADVSPSLNDLGTCGPNASVEELRMIDLTRALARFRAFPDDIRIALEGDKTAQLQTGGLVEELSLPGGELDDGAPRGGEGRVPPRGIVPPRGVHRHEPHGGEPRGGALLQQTGHGRAMDKRRQAGGQDDAAFLPSLPRQRGTAVVESDCLQPRQPLAATGAACGDQ